MAQPPRGVAGLPCPSPMLSRFSHGFSCIKNVNREIISLGESNYGAKPLLGRHAKHMEGSRCPQMQGAGGEEVLPLPQPAQSPHPWHPSLLEKAPTTGCKLSLG